MQVIDLSVYNMLLAYILLIIPFSLLIWLKVGSFKNILLSLVRMSLQLLLVGIYLKYIFQYNFFLVNIVYILAMVVVANISILRQNKFSVSKFIPYTFFGITVGSFAVLFIGLCLVISPTPIYDARYMIPIFGMILGNCMRGNLIALERFYTSIRDNENEFITYQTLGATLSEAVRPYMRTAVVAAIGPQLSTIATMGIVSLPGMMTGQMLGGSVPFTAIKYQIVVMLFIFSAQVMTIVISLLLTMRAAFDSYGMLKRDIFVRSNDSAK